MTTALFLEYDKISLEETVRVFEDTEANTGLKLSYEKMVIFRIGSIKDSDTKLNTQKQLKWSKEGLKLLRIEISNQLDLTQRNYNNTIDIMESICKQWMNQKITLMGKVIVVNSLMEFLFVYQLNCHPKITENLYKKKR